MTDKQINKHFWATNIKYRESLKMFSKFKLIVEDAIERQKKGHTDGWIKVQNMLDKINDKFDCETFLNDY
jgi:hypothetical protein